MANPLSGIRVLECGQFIAGPFAGMLLADLGADVVKVEKPASGDPFRHFGTGGKANAYSHNFCAFNRNKRSLTLDIARPEGQALFRRLAASADVVLDNFRAGVMERLGLGPDALRAINPRLVTCAITGFAPDGPNAGRPAYDGVGQAVSGMLHTFLDPEDPRMRGPTITDQISGMQAAQGVLAALLRRERTGVGAHVSVTMADASVYHMPDAFTALTMSGFAMDSETRAAFSLSFVFRCADGKVVCVQLSSIEKFWHAFLAALERPDIGEDPRFADRAGRIRNFRALVDTLRPVLATRPRAEWIARLAARDVPASEVNDIAEAMADPEIVHAGMFRTIEDDRHGRLTLMRRAVRIDGEREDGALPPPLLGEHSDAVLARDAGLSAEEIAALRAAGVV
ncbi:MAG: CoA transferase [Acetobacteraceae bacterium]|nr:CoA transferase [Acetobacteraceae bacterium]